MWRSQSNCNGSKENGAGSDINSFDHLIWIDRNGVCGFLCSHLIAGILTTCNLEQDDLLMDKAARDPVVPVKETGPKWHGGIKQPIPVPVDKAWELAGNFCALQKWVKGGVERCDLIEGEYNMPGCVRHVIWVGGKTWAKEKLLSIDEDNYSLSYALLDNTLGLVGYVSQLKLRDLNDGTIVVDWSFETDPVETETEEEVAARMTSTYEIGIRALQAAFKPESSN